MIAGLVFFVAYAAVALRFLRLPKFSPTQARR